PRNEPNADQAAFIFEGSRRTAAPAETLVYLRHPYQWRTALYRQRHQWPHLCPYERGQGAADAQVQAEERQPVVSAEANRGGDEGCRHRGNRPRRQPYLETGLQA